MYYMKTYFCDYSLNNKKDKNHIQSKYCKLRDCLETGKMEGNGSMLARGYKVFIENMIFKVYGESQNAITDILKFYGLSEKYFTGRYYKGDFKNIPEFYTLKKLPVEKKNEFILLEKKEKKPEKKKEEKKPEKKPEKKKQKIKIEEKKEEKKEISEQDQKFLKQVESVKNKCNIQEEKNNALKDKILNAEIDFTDIKKQYHRNCHMNNQLSLLLEMNPTDLREKLKRLNEDMENKILEAEQKLSEA